MSCPVNKGSTTKKKRSKKKKKDEYSAGATDLLSAVAKFSFQPSALECDCHGCGPILHVKLKLLFEDKLCFCRV